VVAAAPPPAPPGFLPKKEAMSRCFMLWLVVGNNSSAG
jgi:hypothetical protein